MYMKDVHDFAKNLGYNFPDTNRIYIHVNMSVSIGDTVQMIYSDDQTDNCNSRKSHVITSNVICKILR